MNEFATEQLTLVDIEDELKKSYLDYAMSVIVGRALPDIRDGLKPVHRRTLFAMHELRNDWNKPYKKSARVVGDVIGKYHPHGDTAVYDSIVRMAQPFSLRYMLVDGQGNFGSVDGDPPAAMRYTEVRMSKVAHFLLSDLDKDTVDFVPNYDETEFAPTVFPTRIPNLLVNGSSGIAVGMATNIPPHNLGETIDASLLLLDDDTVSVDDLMEHIHGPDFPTAAIINGKAGIMAAYKYGRGKIYVRAKVEVETNEKTQRQAIIINELPYQVNKARLIEKIAFLVKNKKIEGISALRDESDKDGMRGVIELKKGESSEIILNNLFAQTQMQTVFGINMVALVNGCPKVVNLKQMLQAFLYHRQDVVTRRSRYELNKTKKRTHLLEGLMVALANIDAVIALIKKSANPKEAKKQLLAELWVSGDVTALLERAAKLENIIPQVMKTSEVQGDGYKLSDEQVQAILDLKLHRLTALEKNKINDEYEKLLNYMAELAEILSNVNRLKEVVKEELLEVKKNFADSRRTEILDAQHDLDVEDLIPDETVVVTLSQDGYVKNQPLDTYQAQHRGGRGKIASKVKNEDVIKSVLIANTHDTLLCFSTLGRIYWLKAFRVPQAGRAARGKPIINLLPLNEHETISRILPIREFSPDKFIIMATAKGLVKKTQLSAYSRPRVSGIIAIDLAEDDQLVASVVTNGSQDIMLFTDVGKVIRFNEKDARAVGRTAKGVRGIKLKEADQVISMQIAEEAGQILTVTENGYGKRTDINDYKQQSRAGQGCMSIQVNARNGAVVGALSVTDTDEIMMISDQGMLVRIPVAEISVIGRNTQGVRLIKLNDNDKLVGVAKYLGCDAEEKIEE